MTLTAAAAVIPLHTETVNAADHLDAPRSTANLPADITDLYAWHTGEGKVVTFANLPLNPPKNDKELPGTVPARSSPVSASTSRCIASIASPVTSRRSPTL